jgi:hypothetical protein
MTEATWIKDGVGVVRLPNGKLRKARVGEADQYGIYTAVVGRRIKGHVYINQGVCRFLDAAGVVHVRKREELRRSVKLPEPQTSTSVILGDRIVFMRMEHDPDSESPFDWGTLGTLYTFKRNHLHFNVHEASAALESDRDAVPLSYYEHGNCLWDVAGGARIRCAPDAEWDQVGLAGVWVPDDDTRGAAPAHSKRRREYMRKRAAEVCAVYTQYCNGEVYWVSVLAYAVRRDERGEVWERQEDYRRETPLSKDSCGGLFGYEYAQEELLDLLVQAQEVK